MQLLCFVSFSNHYVITKRNIHNKTIITILSSRNDEYQTVTVLFSDG